MGSDEPPDEHRPWSPSESAFNSQIRDWVVHAILFFISTTVAHFKLKHWRRPLEHELPDLANLNDIHDLKAKEENKNDHIVYRIGQIACTFGVSIGFLCLTLVPLSLASNELKVMGTESSLYPEWWFEWLTADLLLGFWHGVSFVCSICLFVILPFSFLLVEADGFSFGPRTGIRARIYEAFVIFALLLLLVLFFFCLILVVSGAFDIADGIRIIPRLASEVIPIIRTISTFIALLELLWGVRSGQERVIKQLYDEIIASQPLQNPAGELRRLRLEREHIQRRINFRHRLRRQSTSKIALQQIDHDLAGKIAELEATVNQSWFKKWFMKPVMLCGFIAIMGSGTITSVFRTAQLLTSRLLPVDWFGFDRESSNLRFSPRHFGKLSLAANYGMFRYAVSSVKLALSIWLAYSATVGCVVWMPDSWRPVYLGTPLHQLILQCMYWLHLCSAVPLLSALLTGLPLPIDFSGSPALIGSSFQIIACLYYAVCSGHCILKLIPIPVRDRMWLWAQGLIRPDEVVKNKFE